MCIRDRPYSKHFFEELINTGKIKEIYPSDVWYNEREDFSEKAIGISMEEHHNGGFELLRGCLLYTSRCV